MELLPMELLPTGPCRRQSFRAAQRGKRPGSTSASAVSLQFPKACARQSPNFDLSANSIHQLDQFALGEIQKLPGK